MQTDSTIQHLVSLRDEFYRKYKSIDETINLLTEGKGIEKATINTRAIKDGYDKTATMRNKLVQVLKKAGKFLHIRQIAALLHEYEPDVSEKEFIGRLYPAMAALKKSGTIVKFAVDNSNLNTFWGSKNWLDDSGKIKNGFAYDEDQIKNNKSEDIEI